MLAVFGSSFLFFTLSLLMCRCLRLPFVGPFMPSLGSCDNTGTAALKRYIVEHKAVTHAAVQTLALSGLTDRPPSDEYNSPTLLWAIALGDSIMTSCDVIGTSTFVWCNPRTHTETNTLFFFFFFFNVHEIGAQTPRPRLQLSPFYFLLQLSTKGPLWAQKD